MTAVLEAIGMEKRFPVKQQMLITHDSGVIHYMSDFIVVINRGRIVEQGEGSQLIRTPKDDYTKRLIASSCSTGEGCVCGVR